jgi:hypothetical protein
MGASLPYLPPPPTPHTHTPSPNPGGIGHDKKRAITHTAETGGIEQARGQNAIDRSVGSIDGFACRVYHIYRWANKAFGLCVCRNGGNNAAVCVCEADRRRKSLLRRKAEQAQTH